MKHKMNDRGFTFVEIIVVIIIIGILITIAVVSFANLRDRTNIDVCLSNQRTITIARVYNYLDTGSFGNTAEEITETLKKIGFNESSPNNELACPNGGTYLYIENSSKVTCSIERHNL